jgi:hypothetical protein
MNSNNEILNKLKEAGTRNYFTLTLSLNGTVIEEIDFSADKFHHETLLETRTYFLMSDLKKKVLDAYSEKEKEIQEKLKNDQINNLWKKFENEK